jgi:mitochondrial fission protein ELM1
MKEILDNLIIKVILPNFPVDDYELIVTPPSDFINLESYDIKYYLSWTTSKPILEELVNETRMLLNMLGMVHIDDTTFYNSHDVRIINVVVRGNIYEKKK